MSYAWVPIAILVTPLLSAQAPPAFEDFEKVFQPVAVNRAADLPAWNWPAADAFRKRFEGHARDSLAHATFEADAKIGSEGNEVSGRVHGVASRDDEGIVIRVIVKYSGERTAIEAATGNVEWRIKAKEIDVTQPASATDWDGRTLVLTGIQLAQAPPMPWDLWADWAYVATLLEADPDKPDDPKISGGRCSHDTGPIVQAQDHALGAEREGRLDRFLRLRLRIVTDAFERMAWSSTGDAAHDTAALSLARAPIDLDRFLMGLTLVCDGANERIYEVGVKRLGRAIVECGRAPALIPRLRRLAQDPDLDGWNRFRCAAVLAHVLAHDPSGKPLNYATSHTRSFEDVAATMRDLRLPPMSRRWLGLE